MTRFDFDAKSDELFRIGKYYVIKKLISLSRDEDFCIRYQPDPGTSYQVATAPDMIQAVAKAMEMHDSLPDPNKLKVE